jgi:hypothetical protein
MPPFQGLDDVGGFLFFDGLRPSLKDSALSGFDNC